MTRARIATLEQPTRSAFGWTLEGYDGRVHYGAVLAALVPAIGILAVAATLLLAII